MPMYRNYLMAWGSAIVNQVLHIPPDAGAGAGGSGGAGAASSGSGAADAGAGSGGSDNSGGAAPVKITGDTLVDLGDGQPPAKWSSLTAGEKARFMPRDSYDRGVNYLQTEAQKLEKIYNKLFGEGSPQGRGRQQQQGQGQGQGQQPPRDPWGNVRGKPVIDGDTLASVAEQMQRDGLGPMAQVIAQMATRMQALEAQLGETRNSLAPHQETRARQEFEGMVATTISKLEGIKGLPEGAKLDPANPVVREIAEDLYSSYEADSWKPGDFDRMLKARMEGLIALVRGLDTQALEHANKTRRERVFPNLTRGAGRGTGDGKYKFQRPSDISQMARDAGMFGSNGQ